MERLVPLGTVIFDCDSTLISRESLEELLFECLPKGHENARRILEIGNLGMEGQLSFRESMERRLRLAEMSRSDFITFRKKLLSWLTKGILELIRDLRQVGVEVWILSGAPKEFLAPLAEHLCIEMSHVEGVELVWGDGGELLGLDREHPMSESKVRMAESLRHRWSAPTVMVGDGYTDYQLFELGLVDEFVAYTEHRCRDVLLQKVEESRRAANVQVLTQILRKILKY